MDTSEKIKSLSVVDRKSYLSILIISTLVSILSLIVPIAAQMLVNIVAFTRIMQPIVVIGIVVFAILIGSAILSVWQHIIVEIIQQKLFANVVLDCARKLPFLKQSALDRYKGPELVNQFFDVITVQKSLADILIYGTNIIISAIFGMILLALYHPFFLLFDILLIIAVILAVWLPYKTAMTMAHEECRHKHLIGFWLEELVANPFLFKFNHNSQFALKEADNRLVEYLKARNRHFSMIIRHIGAIHGISALAMCVLLGVGGYLVINNQLSLGQLVAGEIVLSGIIASFKHFALLLKDYYDMIASNDKVDHLLNVPVESSKNESGEFPKESIKSVELKINNLSFKNTDDSKALNAFTDAKHPLILGPSDAQFAHNLLSLLSGYPIPFQGDMLLNGKRTNHYIWYELRELIVFLQDIEIFSGTILDNVLLGKKVSRNKLFTLLDELELGEKILNLEDGFDTNISTNESIFTFAELKLIMIVRAVLAKPKLLILNQFLDNLSHKQCLLAHHFLKRHANFTLVMCTRQNFVFHIFKQNGQNDE